MHSRLIELEGQLESELSECLRLGMMALLATTFRRPHSFEQPYSKVLLHKFQNVYKITKSLVPNLDQKLDTWLVFVCLISGGITDEQHVGASLMATVLSWEELRAQLKQVMWIEAFHDDLGRRAVESLKSGYDL